MPYRVTDSALNASTIDILNVIRTNANYEYQSLVPEVDTANDIPKVGEVLYGHPALANQFLNALINRIALVRVKSATFNNPYVDLKKGYLNFGETVEEIFVEIAKPIEFSAEKGVQRELKRTLPDVQSAFHVMNWRVMYPVTIQDDDLRMAFTSIDGVRDLISKVVDSVYRAAEYDEYLLFKYMLIKGVNNNAILVKRLGVDVTDKDIAIALRSASNKLEFLSDKYNSRGVHTNTKRDDQYIFMSADYNAQFDVEVLASAFNMDKATFMGHLKLVDDWTTFDNERWNIIRENSTMVEEVTDDELNIMSTVKAIIVDEEFFQIYDNNNKFTETYVASGLYWNYFYHVWKTVSWSPFSNAIAFIAAVNGHPAATINAVLSSRSDSAVGTVCTLEVDGFDNAVFDQNYGNGALIESGAALTPNGALIFDPESPPTPTTNIAFKVNNGGRELYFVTTFADIDNASVGQFIRFDVV